MEDERQGDIQQLEDDYFYDDIFANLDDIFTNILEEIEMEISNTESGQMVGNCERIREVQNSDCNIVEDYFDDPSEIEVEINMSKDPPHLSQPHQQYFYQPDTSQFGSDELSYLLDMFLYQANEQSGDGGKGDYHGDH